MSIFDNSETLRDYNRLQPNFRKSMVSEAFPEHYAQAYPNLVNFFERYYEYLDSDEQWGGIINEIATVRDVEDTTLARLDFLLDEIGLGVAHGQFTFPREAAKNMGNFFRVKGTQYSGYGFFRGFYDETAEIQYPKKDIFTVGAEGHNLGYDYGKVQQNGKEYQVFSTMIKTPIALNTWETLYRKFVHPSGFYLASQVEVVGIGIVGITTAESFFDPRADIEDIFTNTPYPYQPLTSGDVTLLIPDDKGGIALAHPDDSSLTTGHPFGVSPDFAEERMNPYRTVQLYGMNTPINILMTYYKDIKEFGAYDLTFDAFLNIRTYAQSGYVTQGYAQNVSQAMRMSSTINTFDQVRYIGYDSAGE